jgi:hypothetical protein
VFLALPVVGDVFEKRLRAGKTNTTGATGVALKPAALREMSITKRSRI